MEHEVIQLLNFIVREELPLSPKTIRTAIPHVGAVLADTILQAGVNYRTVVQPRVERIISSYPKAVRLGGFAELVNDMGPFCVLQWKHPEKPRRLIEAIRFFSKEGLDSCNDFRAWFEDHKNSERLLDVRGFGPKTVDYLQVLVGIGSVAVDRHVITFSKWAGLTGKSYQETRFLFIAAADELEISPSVLDSAVWNYVISKKSQSQGRMSSSFVSSQPI